MITTQIVKRFGSKQIALSVANHKIEFNLSSGTLRRYENQLIEWNNLKKLV